MLLQDKHVKNLKKWVEDGDYCFLCDNHPSSGHDDDCPLSEAAQPSAQADGAYCTCQHVERPPVDKAGICFSCHQPRR